MRRSHYLLKWAFSSQQIPLVNYYEIMELSPNFTDTELKAKYLELVKKYHPDLSQDPNAAASFRQIQEAYSVLSDVQSRNSYQLAMEPILKGDLTEESLRCAANIRKCFYQQFSRKEFYPDSLHFSYKLFKEHYEKVEVPKSEYIIYSGHDREYYEHKTEQRESPIKQIVCLGAAIAVVFGSIYLVGA